MIVGGYSLHLYCRNEGLPVFYRSHLEPVPAGHHDYAEFPHQFDGRTEAQCKMFARKRGWKFTGGDAVCPRCAKSPPPTARGGVRL